MPTFQQRFDITSPATAPPWLLGPNGEAYLYCFGLVLDGLLEKQFEGQQAKLPRVGEDPSLIPYQAADRLFVQGPAETNASFIVRMQDFLNAWKRAGSRYSVLGQIQAYLTDLQPGVAAAFPECLIVGGNSDASTWDTIFRYMPQGEAPAHRIVTPPNWNWDGAYRENRAWLALFMNLVSTGQSGSSATVSSTGGSGVTGVTTGFATINGLSGLTPDNLQNYLTLSGCADPDNNGTFQIVSVHNTTQLVIANPNASSPDTATAWGVGKYPFIAPAPVWGSSSFTWGNDYTWGVDCSPQVIISIRQILARWKSAGTFYPNIIISFGGGDGTAGKEFSPLSSQGSGNPDGTWGGIGKKVAGAWVPAKEPLNPFTAFCDGTGIALQCYEKNRT